MGQGRNENGFGGDIDHKREETTAYEYLCHLEEARAWISECIGEQLPAASHLEDNFRNGVYFAKLGHYIAPSIVIASKIFDPSQERWRQSGLHFKHTENINYFLQAANHVGLPNIFLPETTDIYDRKNMPRAVFCIHALSLIMYNEGKAPQLPDLYGRVQFTDAEINTMQEELNRTGVELPQFRKLGGMLGSDGQHSDRDQMDALFQALYEGSERRDLEFVMSILTNKLTRLADVVTENARHYMVVLHSEARSLGRPFRQREIQGLLSRTNLLVCLEKVKSHVLAEDASALLLALRDKTLGLLHLVDAGNAELYLTNLMDIVDDLDENEVLKTQDIKEAVVSANLLGKERNSMEHAINAVNDALRFGDCSRIVGALTHPALRLQQVEPAADLLYYTELGYIQRESGTDLTYDGICKPVAFLNLVAKVGIAGLAGDERGVAEGLRQPDLYLQEMQNALMEEYSREVIKESRRTRQLIPHPDLQDIIERVNEQSTTSVDRIRTIEGVNRAVLDDGHGLKEALELLGFTISRREEVRCFQELITIKANRSQMEGGDMELWLEDIQEAVTTVTRLTDEAVSVAGALRGINSAVEYRDINGVLSYLANNWQLFGLRNRPDRRKAEEILKGLERRLVGKQNGNHSWVTHYFQDGSRVYIEVEGGRISWIEPNLKGSSRVLSTEEILESVLELEGGYSKHLDNLITKLQARIRGFLVRRALFDKLDWWDRHTTQIILIQALWRGKQTRRKVVHQLESDIRRRTSALNYLHSIGDLKKFEKQVVTIQRAWRAKKLRNQWKNLVDTGMADLATVVKHLHLLDVRVEDAGEELEVARARGELTKLMRKNETLEEEVESMDKKIGLLVQNRISVQDVIQDKKKGLTLGRGRTGSSGGSQQTGTCRGLKALKKESQDRLKAYQQLFYLLQTDPEYIARLMFAVPQVKTKFLETLIFTLYNYGGNQREEYLLIKLFKAALQKEIETKVQSLDDIVKNTPLVLKFVVSYNRNGRGGYQLRQLLGPLLKRVLEDKSVKINVSAIEVYKLWVNQTEIDTGEPSGLPYDVSLETALGYEEVQKRLEKSISILKKVSTMFLSTITNSVPRLPYGILYIAKVLYGCLAARFPESKEKDILKVVGNLIYYKFINPVIVSPDRFDMLEKRKDETLSNEQRRNLAHVAKILQFASSKIGFGHESPHLECMNPFIVESHEKFKLFFARCCQVAEPETFFNIDQYTEAALIAKPNIYLSLSELHETHQLLLDHQQSVITHSGDPLLPLLSSLGPPSLSALLGAAEGDCSSLSALGQTEVCLILNPVNEGNLRKDMSDTDRLWVKTKQLLLAILPAASISDKQSLIGLLKSRTTYDQETEYNRILDDRESEAAASKHHDLEIFDIFSDEEGRLPLEDAKRLVLKNLRILETLGYTSSKTGCQSIITDIAKDILNQREHRVNRRRELVRLRRTRAGLVTKQQYMLDQLEQYRQYTNQCLANLNRAGTNKRVHFSTLQGGEKERKLRSKAAVKYSATKLYDKGVLYTIEGLPANQLKNVMFIFTPLEKDGTFQVAARFMGVDMENVTLDIQDLLKLQYEGVAVTGMFGKAKINVNLLLHLLNTKFYGK